MRKHNRLIDVIETVLDEVGSEDKVHAPKLTLEECQDIARAIGTHPAGVALYQAVNLIYGSSRVLPSQANALLLDAIKHVAVAITENWSNSAQEYGKNFCREHVAYVSTAHITDTDSENLAKMSWKDGDSIVSGKLHVVSTECGYFIHLNGLSMDLVHEELEMSMEFKRLIACAIAYKFDWLHLDADGEIVDGLPTHNW